MKKTKKELNWQTDEMFYIPKEATAHFQKIISEKEASFEKWAQEHERIIQEKPEIKDAMEIFKHPSDAFM